MSSRRNAGFITLIIALVLFLAWAGGAQARGLVPCGNEAAGEPPCNFCHLFQLTDNIIDQLIFPIVPIIAALMIAVGGVYLFFGGPSENALSTGKRYIRNAIIGLIIVYVGWVVVGTVIASFVRGANLGSFNFTATKGIVIQCNLTEAAEFKAPELPATPGRTSACAPLTRGYASVNFLQDSCFGANADIASGVANAESGGDAALASVTDRCADGRSVSWGLFQINISANKLVTPNGTLDCPKAFEGGPLTGSNRNCRVIDEKLYKQCVSAAINAALNIQNACLISSNGNNWKAWGPRTLRVCGL